jgi:CMP-N,N'-diacetyllegionaminic acid synthase
MLNNKTFLAIIPARGGSKRLPRKNILNLAGKPLIEWTIEAGLKSIYIDKLIVTSDDIEILQISQKAGAEIIIRPKVLASDTATTFEAIKHVIDALEKRYDYIVLLQPTSPLRTSKQIDSAILQLDIKQADAIISVCKVDHSPLWSNTLPEDNSMNSFIKDDIKNKRSQELDTYYRINGAIYICKIERFLEEKSFLIKDKIYAYEMDRINSIDIDEKIDFLIASTLLENSCLKEKNEYIE